MGIAGFRNVGGPTQYGSDFHILVCGSICLLYFSALKQTLYTHTQSRMALRAHVQMQHEAWCFPSWVISPELNPVQYKSLKDFSDMHVTPKGSKMSLLAE